MPLTNTENTAHHQHSVNSENIDSIMNIDIKLNMHRGTFNSPLGNTSYLGTKNDGVSSEQQSLLLSFYPKIKKKLFL